MLGSLWVKFECAEVVMSLASFFVFLRLFLEIRNYFILLWQSSVFCTRVIIVNDETGRRPLPACVISILNSSLTEFEQIHALRHLVKGDFVRFSMV